MWHRVVLRVECSNSGETLRIVQLEGNPEILVRDGNR